MSKPVNFYLNLLIVSEDAVFADEMKTMLSDRLSTEVKIANSLASVQERLQQPEPFDLVLIDHTYEGERQGEFAQILEQVADKEVPTLVFTEKITSEFREKVMTFNVLDYLVKSTSYFFDDLVRLIERLRQNVITQLLVVDNCETTRLVFSNMLEFYGFQVEQAESAEEALTLLKQPGMNIKMLLMDTELEDMEGLEFLKEVRSLHSLNQTAVMAMSYNEDPIWPAQYLKLGANDFIRMPFIQEELLSRIYQCLGFLERYEVMQHTATTDFLTGLPNRRHFFENSRQLFANAVRGNIKLTTIMVDIDFFKKINDTHGHNAGDYVLSKVSKTLKRSIRKSDLIGRLGGEEFCIVATNVKEDYLDAFLDRLRKSIEDLSVTMNGESIPVTISLGAAYGIANGLEETISIADEKLYEAKEAGRNQYKVEYLPDLASPPWATREEAKA